jgi:NAD(P)-dependent dehydrogenase (short-subunit alcohol dehydrogenase family)
MLEKRKEGRFMMQHSGADLFDLSGYSAVVTGGTGALGTALARGLAHAGAKVAVLARRRAGADRVVSDIEAAGGEALALTADVLEEDELEAACALVLDRWGRVDILVNAAGGNVPEATVSETRSFFDLTPDAWRTVVNLNLLGTILPSQVFGAAMVRVPQRASGAIVNISSMSADRALTRVVGYGAAKAGVESLTRWLAAEMARRYGPGMRVNAIAPGFFIGDQNRELLIDPEGNLTGRGQRIIDHTPAGRFGEPDDLVSTLLWLCGPGARFVTGVVVPVDGGFSAFSGV